MAFAKIWNNPKITIGPATRDILQNVYIRRRPKRRNRKLANLEITAIAMVNDPWNVFTPPP